MNRWDLSWCHPFQVFLIPVTFTGAHLGGSHGTTALIGIIAISWTSQTLVAMPKNQRSFIFLLAAQTLYNHELSRYFRMYYYHSATCSSFGLFFPTILEH
jgi:hypothetical protein